MFLAALLLLAAPQAGDPTMESLVRELRSDEGDARSNATARILESWSRWKDPDLSILDGAVRDADPEVSARAAEIRGRIRVRRALGKTLVERIPRVDEAFYRGDDAAKLAALREAKKIWKDGGLAQGDLADLQVVATDSKWSDPTAFEEFLREPDAQRVFLAAQDLEARARVRTREVEILGRQGKERSEKVAEYLHDGAPEVRTAALRVMGGIQARELAPKVAALLKDRNPGVRSEALALLGSWETKEYAADFATLLEDPVGPVRWRAAAALGALGQRTTGPQIARLLKDPFAPTRAEAAMTLGVFGAREFAPNLVPLLSDPQAIVRRSAAYALGRFGAVELAPLLKPLLRDKDPEVRTTAAHTLGQLAVLDGLVDLLRDGDPEVRAEAAWVLGYGASPEAVRRIAALLEDRDAEVRHAAVQALGLHRAREFRAGAAALLQDRSDWVRSEAAVTLGRIGVAEDARRIAALLRDPDRKVRVTAALALGDLGAGDPDGILAGLEGDPDRLLGLASTLSLVRLGKGDAAALRRIFQEISTNDLAFACLGTTASDVASFVQSREAWALLDRPLKVTRAVETWTDLSSALSDAGLKLEIQTEGMIGRLDRGSPMTGRNALSWLLGRFGVPDVVLEDRKIRLMDRRDSLLYWQKRLEGK
jgi:HEAT repeat protein